MVKIIRKAFFKDRLYDYSIVIDEIEYGNIKPRQTKLLDITSGEHTIYLKIADEYISNKIDFNILDNELIEFECGNNTKIMDSFKYDWAYLTYVKHSLGFEYLWIKIKS